MTPKTYCPVCQRFAPIYFAQIDPDDLFDSQLRYADHLRKWNARGADAWCSNSRAVVNLETNNQ